MHMVVSGLTGKGGIEEIGLGGVGTQVENLGKINIALYRPLDGCRWVKLPDRRF